MNDVGLGQTMKSQANHSGLKIPLCEILHSSEHQFPHLETGG